MSCRQNAKKHRHKVKSKLGCKFRSHFTVKLNIPFSKYKSTKARVKRLFKDNSFPLTEIIVKGKNHSTQPCKWGVMFLVVVASQN